MMAEEKYFLSIKADEINDVLVRASTKPVGAQIGNFPVFSSGRDLADSGKNTSSYSLALKTTDGPSGSVDIYPDEGSDIVVTVHGRTEQEGSGDPSPTNIRPIKSAGIWDNLFDPSLLIPSFLYDPQTNTTRFEAFGTEEDAQYDWFNGTIGSSSVANNVLQLKANTRYEISITSLVDSGVFFFNVDSEGKASQDGKLYFSAGKNLRGYIVTTATGKITIRSTYANKGSTVTGLRIAENWFDPALLYSDVEYDAASNTVSPPIIDTTETYYDIFNGGFGVSTSASKTIQLKANTKYGIVCDNIKGASLFVFLVSSSGSTFSAGVACSVGEDGRVQIFETSENSRITLRVYRVNVQTGYSNIRIFELSNSEYKSIVSCRSFDQKNVIINTREPLLDGDYADTSGVEVHEKRYFVFSGNENWYLLDNVKYPQLIALDIDFYPVVNSIVSSHAVNKIGSNTPGSFYTMATSRRIQLNPTGGQWGDILSGWTDETLVNMWKAWLAQQYESGTPLQVVVTRREPISYTNEPFAIPAKPDNSGKVTVAGSDSVSVTYNKSLVHAFSELQSAIIALGASMQGGL